MSPGHVPARQEAPTGAASGIQTLFGADAVSISVTTRSYGLSSLRDCRNHSSKCFVAGLPMRLAQLRNRSPYQ